MFNAYFACFSAMTITKEIIKELLLVTLIVTFKIKNLKHDSNQLRVSGTSKSKFSKAYRVGRMVSFKWNEMVPDPLRIWSMKELFIIKYDAANKN